MSYHVMSCHIMSYHVISCHIMSCHVIPYHVMSYHVISCHIMSYHVIWHSIAWYSIGYVIVYVALCYVLLVKSYLMIALDMEEKSTIEHERERAYGCMLTYLRDRRVIRLSLFIIPIFLSFSLTFLFLFLFIIGHTLTLGVCHSNDILLLSYCICSILLYFIILSKLKLT
jgi:hypothetical protein